MKPYGRSHGDYGFGCNCSDCRDYRKNIKGALRKRARQKAKRDIRKALRRQVREEHERTA